MVVFWSLSAALAADIHVPADRPSLAGALSVAKAGDVILLDPYAYDPAVADPTLVSTYYADLTIESDVPGVKARLPNLTLYASNLVLVDVSTGPGGSDAGDFGLNLEASTIDFTNVDITPIAPTNGTYAYGILLWGCSGTITGATGIGHVQSTPIGIEGSQDGSSPWATAITITGSDFESNQQGSVEMVYLKSTDAVDITSSRFASNTTPWSGSAVAAPTPMQLTLVDDDFSDNVGSYDAGAVSASAADVVVQSCTFTNNLVKSGKGGDLAFNSEWVEAFGGSLDVEDSVFSGASRGGEAAHLYADMPATGGPITLIRDRFCDHAYGHGQVRVSGPDVTVVSNVFSDPTSAGPALVVGGTALVRNDTFVDAGSAVLDGSAIEFVNDLFYRGTVTGLTSGSSGRYDLWFGDLPIDVNVGSATDAGGDPLFVTSFDPTNCATEPRLQAGSPAIDAGDPSILDRDGSRSDIGAYGGPDAEPEAADTGDTGTEDTGYEDTGVTDTGDSGDTGGDTGDTDADSGVPDTGGGPHGAVWWLSGGGGCGCDHGGAPGVGSLAGAALAALWLRRAPRRGRAGSAT